MIRFRLVLVLGTILIGAGTTIWGISQMSWQISPLVPFNSIYRWAGLLAVGALAIEAISRWLRIGPLASGAVVVVLVTILTGTIWPLFVSLWFALACYVMGLAIISVLGIDSNRISGLNAFLIGAGAYGTAIGLLAHIPLNYPGVYGILLGLPILLGWRPIKKAFKLQLESRHQAVEDRWLDLSIALIALVHLIVALMPEVGHDALAMHLFIPGHLLLRHEWSFDVSTYVWAVMPMMGDWIFSIGYMLAGETAARMLNVGFLFALCWLIRDLVKWVGGSDLGVKWAVLLFLTTPLVYRESSSLLIESIWASFVVAGTYSIFRLLSSDQDSNIHLPIAGFLLGCALAAKAVTFTVLPGLLLLLIICNRTWLKVNFAGSLILGLALFLMVGAIPYLTAFWVTGNPVFPFFNEYFQSPQYPAVNFSASSIFEKGVSWDTIYRITFDSGRYLESRPGAAGFQWLLFLIPTMMLFAVDWNRKGIALVFVGVLAVVFTFQQTAYLRYIFPSFVILSAAIGVAISVIFSGETIFVRRVVLVVGLSAILLNICHFKSATSHGDIALQPLMSEVGRTEYLRRRLPIRSAVDLVNELNIDNRPVAVFAPPLTAGLSSDALYSSWYNHAFRLLIQEANNVSAIADVLVRRGVDYVILDKNRANSEKRHIIEKATSEVSKFGPISVRVLREEYRLTTELLKDTDFLTDDYWQLSNGARKEGGGVVVSSKIPAAQLVEVVPGGRYLLTVVASCLNRQSQGRLQVNWLSAESKFISSTIRVFECTKYPDPNSLSVIAPEKALKAVVYATGHGAEPLRIHKVSFKK